MAAVASLLARLHPGTLRGLRGRLLAMHAAELVVGLDPTFARLMLAAAHIGYRLCHVPSPDGVDSRGRTCIGPGPHRRELATVVPALRLRNPSERSCLLRRETRLA